MYSLTRSFTGTLTGGRRCTGPRGRATRRWCGSCSTATSPPPTSSPRPPTRSAFSLRSATFEWNFCPFSDSHYALLFSTVGTRFTTLPVARMRTSASRYRRPSETPAPMATRLTRSVFRNIGLLETKSIYLSSAQKQPYLRRARASLSCPKSKYKRRQKSPDASD